jgi:DNA-binding HxlR family transcriptional regulator
MKQQQLIRLSDRERVRGVIAIFGREYTMEILEELHVGGRLTASEVARELGIHVATAMRKLAELEGLGLVVRREREGTNLAEYEVKSPRVEILIDLDAEARAMAARAADGAARTYVREKPNRKVIAESDEAAGRVLRLVFLKGARWRTAVKTMPLTEDEGRFLWHLPYASEGPKSVADVCRKAGIANAVHVGRILEFVKESERLGIVEVVR